MILFAALSTMKHSSDCRSHWENGLWSATSVTSIFPLSLDTWWPDRYLKTSCCEKQSLETQTCSFFNCITEGECQLCHLEKFGQFPVGCIRLCVLVGSVRKLRRLLSKSLQRPDIIRMRSEVTKDESGLSIRAHRTFRLLLCYLLTCWKSKLKYK